MEKKILPIIIISTFITACTLTPQEQAQKKLSFQISLARQCDSVAAKLMAQLPKINTLNEQQRASFDKEYQERVNNPSFQSCYKKAFKSYEIELQQIKWDTNAGFFNNKPFNCEFNPPTGPYWGAC